MLSLSNFWNEAAERFPGVLLFCSNMMSDEFVKVDDALENFVAAMSGFPSALRSQVHRSHNSSGAANVTGAAKLVGSNTCVFSEGMNFKGAFAERRVTRLTTSTVECEACAGTRTSTANSEDEITVPLTGPNQTSRLAAVLLKPLPVMTIVSLGEAFSGSTFCMTGAWAASVQGRLKKIAIKKGFMNCYWLLAVGPWPNWQVYFY